LHAGRPMCGRRRPTPISLAGRRRVTPARQPRIGAGSLMFRFSARVCRDYLGKLLWFWGGDGPETAAPPPYIFLGKTPSRAGAKVLNTAQTGADSASASPPVHSAGMDALLSDPPFAGVRFRRRVFAGIADRRSCRISISAWPVAGGYFLMVGKEEEAGHLPTFHACCRRCRRIRLASVRFYRVRAIRAKRAGQSFQWSVVGAVLPHGAATRPARIGDGVVNRNLIMLRRTIGRVGNWQIYTRVIVPANLSFGRLCWMVLVSNVRSRLEWWLLGREFPRASDMASGQ